MKKSLFLLASLLGLITTKINAQTCVSSYIPKATQDCQGAIPLCKLTTTYPTGNICGGGVIPAEIPSGSCLASNEKNTTWYVFKVSQSGKLKFKIKPLDVTPTSNGDTDYDWAVFKLPAGSSNSFSTCSMLKSNLSWQVSCNYSAQKGVTGMYDTVNTIQNDVQYANGSAFNRTRQVIEGEVYVVAVDNFSGGDLIGYTINFTDPNTDTTSASIIPDADTIASVAAVQAPNCSNDSTLVIVFDSEVRCDSVKSSKFTLVSAGGTTHQITTIKPVTGTCSTDNQTAAYYATFAPAAIIDSSYTLTILSGIANMCGHQVKPDTVSFQMTAPFPVNITSVNGMLYSSYVDGAATYQWILDNVPIQGANMFYYTPTTTGIYSVVVTKGGCVQMADISFNVSAINGKNNIADLVTVHPNPSQGVFQLKVTEKMNCIVTDVVGKTIWEKNNVETEELINMSQQANGMYLLKVTTPTGSGTMKLVVQQ